MSVLLVAMIMSLAQISSSPNYLYNDLFKDTNSYRESKDKPKLQYSYTLEKSAQERADFICKSGDWSHDGWTDAVKRYTDYEKAGENLSRGYNQADAVKAWIDSPTHEKVMTGVYETVGFGYTDCGKTNYIVAHYAKEAK